MGYICRYWNLLCMHNIPCSVRVLFYKVKVHQHAMYKDAENTKKATKPGLIFCFVRNEEKIDVRTPVNFSSVVIYQYFWAQYMLMQVLKFALHELHTMQCPCIILQSESTQTCNPLFYTKKTPKTPRKQPNLLYFFFVRRRSNSR